MLPNTYKINLELLSKDLRDGFYCDNEFIDQTDFEDIKKYADELGLYYYPINKKYPKCLLFFKNIQKIKNKTIGEILGYYCHDHERYYDHTIDRYMIGIEETHGKTQIYGEMAQASLVSLEELKNFYNLKMNEWNNIFPEYKFDYNIHFLKGVSNPKDIQILKIK